MACADNLDRPQRLSSARLTGRGLARFAGWLRVDVLALGNRRSESLLAGA